MLDVGRLNIGILLERSVNVELDLIILVVLVNLVLQIRNLMEFLVNVIKVMLRLLEDAFDVGRIKKILGLDVFVSRLFIVLEGYVLVLSTQDFLLENVSVMVIPS